MTTRVRVHPAMDAATTPFLLWNETTTSADAAGLACPQCAGPNLHFDAIHLAIPIDDHYTPAVGLSINPDTGAVTADEQAQRLHAGQNRGPMLAIAYWCENGCLGHVELRQHKGILYAGLHTDNDRQHPASSAQQYDPPPTCSTGEPSL
jgi:hypothetical protein